MAEKTNTFQLVILITFAVFAIIGVFFFASQKNKDSSLAYSVDIWGTERSSIIDNLILNKFGTQDASNVKYTEFSEDSFDTELVEALAEGRGPDVIILSQKNLYRHKDKIYIIPFESMSERDFKNSYIDGASIFMNNNGIFGLPLSVDPIVMYWNKSLFLNAGIINPPKYWDEFANLASKLTKKDFSSNIAESFVALGESSNILHSKEILSMLMLQSGTPIVAWGSAGSAVNMLKYQNTSTQLLPSDVALRFYTEFADPTKVTYSWNRSLPQSQKAFISGDLAIYFGFASDLEVIREANPNLNFDVALVPQARDSVERATYGNFKAISVLKAATDITSSFTVMSSLTDAESMTSLMKSTILPPVGRSLVSVDPEDPYKQVFFDSAIISKTWLDPNYKETTEIFSAMMNDVTSGRFRVWEAITKASNLIDSLLE